MSHTLTPRHWPRDKSVPSVVLLYFAQWIMMRPLLSCFVCQSAIMRALFKSYIKSHILTWAGIWGCSKNSWVQEDFYCSSDQTALYLGLHCHSFHMRCGRRGGCRKEVWYSSLLANNVHQLNDYSCKQYIPKTSWLLPYKANISPWSLCQSKALKPMRADLSNMKYYSNSNEVGCHVNIRLQTWMTALISSESNLWK